MLHHYGFVKNKQTNKQEPKTPELLILEYIVFAHK